MNSSILIKQKDFHFSTVYNSHLTSILISYVKHHNQICGPFEDPFKVYDHFDI